MTSPRPAFAAALGLALAAASAAPALAQDYRAQDYQARGDRGPGDRGAEDRGPEYRGPEYRGPEYRGPGERGPDGRDFRQDRREGLLVGRGVGLLLPELRDTAHGRALVLSFDFNHDGAISPDEAAAANRAFEDRRRDGRRFDREDRRPEFRGPPIPPPIARPESYDRQGMRNYHFRQNRYGAVFNIDDVLFETGSARLRPGFEARLRPLIGYLRSAPRVQVRIDGYTDSVGSDASNLQLSKDRARSVADALGASGVDGRRFQLVGHGETSPVATNDTDAGRRLNRRVEVTLVGQRAESFR